MAYEPYESDHSPRKHNPFLASPEAPKPNGEPTHVLNASGPGPALEASADEAHAVDTAADPTVEQLQKRLAALRAEAEDKPAGK